MDQVQLSDGKGFMQDHLAVVHAWPCLTAAVHEEVHLQQSIV